MLSAPHTFDRGRYEVIRELGKGGKGIVYQARDTTLDRVVAIKLLRPDALDPESLGRFLAEARTLARLTHPNITTIYDIGEEAEHHFVVLEFVDGGDLSGHLEAQRDHPLPPSEIGRIASSVARALDFAHRSGILHRDVKPENILLTSSGDVKLSDFGLAAARSAAVLESGLIVGTVAYLSPEAALGQALTPRSDLYSLGVLMYQMAVGRLPFEGEDAQVLYAHVHDEPPRPRSQNPDLPPAIDSLILRLMAKKDIERPASAAEVLRELQAPWEVSREPVAPARAAERPSERGGFVNRESEMARLNAAMDRLKAGRGSVVLLEGEAGIGKTRMTAELTRRAAREGIGILSGQSTEAQGAPALAPWIEALRGFTAALPTQLLYKLVGTSAGILSRVIPDLPTRLGPAMPSPPVPQDLERFQLFDAITQFLANAARESPVVVTLDDLHWADEASVELLEYGARNTVQERILFLGCYRPEDLAKGAVLEKAVYELNRARRLEQIHLGRLSEADSSAIVANEIGVERIDPALAGLLFERAGGNPFFTEELVASLQEESCIAVEGLEAVWCGGTMRLPETVRHVIERRLARLSGPAQDLLRKASVFGREVRPELLSRMADLDPQATLDLVEEALASGLVREDVEGREATLVFGDPQVRDCLYEGISQLRRRRYHELAADVLAAIPNTSAEELAHHYSLAALPEPARRYLEAAGDEAAALGSFDRSASRYEHALTFWPPEEREPRRRLMTKLGDAYFNAGKWARAKDSFLEARRLIGTEDDDVPIGVRLGPTLWYLGDVTAAREELERALRILGDRDGDDAAAAYNWLATIRLDEGDPEGSEEVAMRALEISKRVGNRPELEFALNNLTWTEAVRGHWQLGLTYLSQELELHASGGAPYDYANACDDAAGYYTHFVPDYRAALEFERKAIEVATRIGNRPAEVRWRLHRAETLIDLGRWDEAERDATAVLGLADELAYNTFVPWIRIVLGRLATLRGDAAGAERWLRTALESAEAEVWWRLHFAGHVHAARAWARAEAGDRSEAREAIRAARSAARQHSCRWCGDSASLAAAWIEAMAPDGDDAAYREAMAEVRQWGTSPAKALGEAAEARWYRHHGQPSEGRLPAAEKYLRQIDNPFSLATVLHEHALTLNALGNTDAGSGKLEEALRIYVALGAKGRAEDVLRSKRILKA